MPTIWCRGGVRVVVGHWYQIRFLYCVFCILLVISSESYAPHLNFKSYLFCHGKLGLSSLCTECFQQLQVRESAPSLLFYVRICLWFPKLFEQIIWTKFIPPRNAKYQPKPTSCVRLCLQHFKKKPHPFPQKKFFFQKKNKKKCQRSWNLYPLVYERFFLQGCCIPSILPFLLLWKFHIFIRCEFICRNFIFLNISFSKQKTPSPRLASPHSHLAWAKSRRNLTQRLAEGRPGRCIPALLYNFFWVRSFCPCYPRPLPLNVTPLGPQTSLRVKTRGRWHLCIYMVTK